MASNFPGGPDTIVNNVNNSTPEMDTHPNVHNQLADAVMAVETALLPGGIMNLAAHVSASDPHPVYLTQVEGDARYALIGGGLTLPLTQNLTFSPDSTYDIGASGANRPRNVYVGTLLNTPRITSPSFLYFNTNGTDRWYVDQGSGHFVPIANATYDIGDSSTTRWVRNVFASAINTSLLIPATSNTVEQRNGTSVQTLRVYGTFTDASNYTRLVFTNNGGGIFQILSDNAGTGTAQALTIGVLGSNVINFITNGTARWSIQNVNGTLQPAGDNTYNLGAASNRIANVWVAGSVVNKVKAGAPVDADFTSPTDGMFAVDSTNSKVWWRVGGVWKGIVIA